MNSSAAIIYNPAARRASASAIETARRLIEERGFDVRVSTTSGRGDAEALARAYAHDNVGLVLAAGGDGTVNEVVNGLAGSDSALGILPLGTSNVLARETAMPADISSAVSEILGRIPQRVSLGRIEPIADVHQDGCGAQASPRLFCLMAGAGFDGRAVRDVSSGLKKISGEAAYVVSGLKTLLSYAPPELAITADGETYHGTVAIAGKISRYGGDFRVTPDARIEDPAFYLCVFKGRKRRDVLRYACGVLAGSHLGFGDVSYVRAREIEIRGGAVVQLDGDYYGEGPVRLTIAEKCLNLLCRPSGGQR